MVMYSGKYPTPILSSMVNNGAPAEALMMEDIAGGVRWLYEYAAGVRANSGVGPIQRGHYGEPGHSHGGGLDGKPLKNTVWSACHGNQTTSLAIAPNTYANSGTAGNNRSMVFQDRTVWIPPGKAYEQLDVEVQVYVSSSGGADYTLKPWTDSPVDWGSSAWTITGSFTANALNQLTVEKVPFIPGRLHNRFGWKLDVERTSGDTVVFLISQAIHQTGTTP